MDRASNANVVKRQRAQRLGFVGATIALVSGCLAPSGPMLTAETVPHVTANPVPSVYGDPVPRSTAVPLPAARAAEPAGGAVDANWQAQTLPVCAGAIADAGTTRSNASTIDWAKLDAGANTGSAKSASVDAGAVSNASQVVAGMRVPFRACYQAALRRARTTAGGVRLLVRVGCDGSVVSVNAVAHDLSEQFVACMMDAIRHAQFNPPEGGSATIAVPVTFVQQ